VEKEKEKKDAVEESGGKETASFEDFLKLDLRVGTIERAEKVEGSKKLLRLRIDDGMGGRQVLAGLAEFIDPESLVGKQVVFVANLKPRKMMGEYSQGMVLAAEDGDGYRLVVPDGKVVPGARVS